MIRVAPRHRAGITLTEILISILIMGVGLVSLATLFPLGLQRVREASRFSRSTLLTESAQNELNARNLLFPGQFQPPGSVYLQGTSASFGAGVPLYPYVFPAQNYYFYDPFIQDGPLPDYTVTTPPDALGNTYIIPAGVYRGYGLDGQGPYSHTPNQRYIPGAGLPVAYDPLWRQVNRIPPDLTGTYHEARFAYGVGFIRPDPDGNPPSAYGLQRVTGVDPTLNTNLPPNPFDGGMFQIFTSPEDVVFQNEGSKTRGPGFGSPVVPDMSSGATQNDFTYTWMFTGQRADVSNVEVYDGDVVVFHNRQFALDAVASPFGGQQFQAAGEVVVEAVFGYNGTIDPLDPGYGNGDNRSVLIRWPVTMKDPEIKVGGWIADVTYERNFNVDISRFQTLQVAGQKTFYPGQRCYWYRIAKKTEAQPAVAFSTDPGAYRSMVLTLTTPVRAKTLLSLTTPPQPVHVNVALVSPYVVNVFSKTFYAR